MNLFTELRAQFSIREWLNAMKQGIKELFNQWSIREWTLAIFCYFPNAHGVKPKAGAKLSQPGESLTFNERFNYLKSQWHTEK